MVDQMLYAVMRAVIAVTPRRLLASLSLRVDEFVRQWQDSASELRKNSWFERFLLGVSSHPWIFLSIAIAVWASIAAALLALGTYVCFPLENFEKSDLPTYFGTAWSVQATVVALVYPLVISFVTLLLQRRATAKVALTAYLLKTGVKPSGISSFALLLLMTFQYLALPWMSIRQLQAVMVADVTWLTMNLSLTGWFLARTTQYLQDEHRVETLQWLTQCVTLPREVRAYAMGLLLQNAQEKGWVPGGQSSIDSDTLKVYLFPMGEGRAVLQRKFSNPKELRDVHFKLLSWAISRWTRAQRTAQSEYPLLELPCTPGDSRAKHILCRVRDAAPPSRPATAAILASYRFAKPTASSMPFTTVEVLDELGREAAVQVELRRDPGFRQALDDLVDVHVGLLRAARYGRSDSELNNMGLLPDPYGLGSRLMVRAWMEPYLAIAEAAVAALEDDPRFIQRTAGLSGWLMYQAGEQPAEVLVELMLSSTQSMYHLGLWWSRRATTELTSEPHLPRLLSPPLRNVYSDAVQGWVDSWENIDVRINKDEVLHDAALWRAHVTRVKVYSVHIDETARLLLGAVARGDAEAARRLEDSLVKWWDGRQYEFGADHDVSQPGWSSLTLSYADLTWNEVRIRIPDLPEGAQADEAATRLLATVLKRYWSDVCMVVAFVLLEHAASIDSSESSLGLEIVGALMGGRGYDKGGTVDIDQHRGASVVMGKIARALFGNRSYSKRLDKIVERYRSDTREPMTSGRPYSFHGTDDVDTLTRGQAIYLTALIVGGHEDIRAFKRLIDEWHEDLPQLDRVSRHFQALTHELRREEFKPHSIIISKLREILERQEPVNDALDRTAALCEEAVKAANETRARTVADAPLDPERFVELKQKVNSRVFSAEDLTDFPIALTTDFVSTDEALEKVSQGFTAISKLPFTKPQLENMDDHLVSWFSQHTARRAFVVALEGIRRKRGIEPVRDDTAQAFYMDLDARISSIIACDLTPVVLVATGRRADYLSPYRLPEDGDVPTGFDIRPPDHPARALHATVNGVEVYSVPMVSSRYLVLPKEWLSTLRYQKREGEIGLSLVYKNESVGKLDITFEFGCEFFIPEAG